MFLVCNEKKLGFREAAEGSCYYGAGHATRTSDMTQQTRGGGGLIQLRRHVSVDPGHLDPRPARLRSNIWMVTFQLVSGHFVYNPMGSIIIRVRVCPTQSWVTQQNLMLSTVLPALEQWTSGCFSRDGVGLGVASPEQHTREWPGQGAGRQRAFFFAWSLGLPVKPYVQCDQLVFWLTKHE